MNSFICAILLFSIGFQRSDLPQNINRNAKYWEWTTWAWTSEDVAVTASIQKIDALAKQGKAEVSEIEKIALSAKKQYEAAKKPDAKLLTIWAYAARTASILDETSSRRTGASFSRYDLELVPAIPTYMYARTRFLVLGDGFPRNHISLGHRLLKKNPKDYPVKYDLVYMVYTFNPNEAKKLNSELLQDYPQKTILYAQRGDVFDVAYDLNRRKDDLLEAKRNYEVFLQKAPSDPYAQMVKIRLKRVTKTLQGL